ncbi:hypothetical protein NP603_08500 [Methylomonas sp. SURF-1]|uniref:IPTL-CTERM protein sorting domain-containing protein n=1 Tax=Methylomonas aurea TaxID=2952224 RepID=A0ABT1UIA0_9GAMM|nr:hypothetical protein [Methylomonas sp. SURF-1]MCQ8181146.1 hypothetical protein [Methylomonas sp. SURF-1]
MKHSALLIALLATPAQVNPTDRPDTGLTPDFAASPAPILDPFHVIETESAAPALFSATIARCSADVDRLGQCGPIDWPAVDYMALSSLAWNLIPEASYRLAIGGFDSPVPQRGIADNPAEAQRLSGLPLAGVAWFSLGCLLGSLALLRRRQTGIGNAIA